ncbi:potassium transporter KefB [Flavihumibacter sp. R14]|nr:potassium transporter KefB [Flavihumibacter soli]
MKPDNSAMPPDQTLPLAKPMLVGAGLGLIVISFFVFGVDQPNPEWGKLWMIRPLIITPIAGAMGGAFYYLMDHLSSRGLNRTAAVILSLFVFFIGLWLGIVLGLDGTMWD